MHSLLASAKVFLPIAVREAPGTLRVFAIIFQLPWADASLLAAILLPDNPLIALRNLPDAPGIRAQQQDGIKINVL